MPLKQRQAGRPWIFGAVILLAQVAYGSTWSTSASTCQPSPNTVGFFAPYTWNGAQYTFLGSNTGEIELHCSVTNPLDSGDPTWNTLVLGFYDPDGNLFETYTIVGWLGRTGLLGGGSEFVAEFEAALPTTGPTTQSFSFTHTFDFTFYAYYIVVQVNRGFTQYNPAVWYLQLK